MSHLRRVCALVAAGTLGLAGLTVLEGPAQAAATDPRPVSIGADWLAGQLTGGLLHNDQYGFDDYGLSIDAGLGLAEVGGHAASVNAISSALASAIGAGHYISGDEFGDTGSTYAGAVAKSAVFAEVAGGDPTSFGSVDLITRLEAQVSTTAPVKGRLHDTSTYGDFANVLGQAYAVRALADASSTKAADATAFLLQQQCPAGFFRLEFAPSAAADQSCAGGLATGDSPADTDATAIATLMLDRSGIDTKAAGLAIARAEAWLLAHQRTDGSFGGGASTEAPNANSTGLAGWALADLGDTEAAAKAASWVRAHQADEVSSCPSDLSSQTGAIAYDDAGQSAGRADGIGTATADQWRRATTQALPVLAFSAPAAGTLSVSGPDGYVRAGTRASYRISGAAPGETICVHGVGSAHPVAAGPTGAITDDVLLPSGTADRTLTASDRAGSSASVVTTVLGATTLTVTPGRHKVHRGHRLRVVVSGLAAGERVTLRLRGVTVRTGHADPAGRFVRVVRVGHRLGTARLLARGEFPTIRHGATVIRVVR